MCHHPDTNGVRPEVSAKIRTQSDRGRNFHPDIGSKPVEHTSGGAFGGPEGTRESKSTDAENSWLVADNELQRTQSIGLCRRCNRQRRGQCLYH